MKIEYPKAVYKSREVCKTVNNADEFAAAIKEGYGTFKDIVLGKIVPDSTSLSDLTWIQIKAKAKSLGITCPRGSSREDIEKLIKGD